MFISGNLVEGCSDRRMTSMNLATGKTGGLHHRQGDVGPVQQDAFPPSAV